MRNFNRREFVMGDENVFDKMDMDLLTRIDVLRDLVDEPLTVTSSFRSVDYNQSVGGSKSSMHLLGRAVDLSCNNGTLRRKIVKNALDLGLSVGVAKLFIHIDNRDNEIVFTY